MSPIFKLAIVAISLLAMPNISLAQDNDSFEIPYDTDANPLLDVKYKIEFEPFLYPTLVRVEVAYRTYLSYTASYADGTVKSGRNFTGNHFAIDVIGSLSIGICDWQTLVSAEWGDGECLEDGKVWSQKCINVPEAYVDLSDQGYYETKEVFMQIKNVNNLTPFITSPYTHPIGMDQVGDIETLKPLYDFDEFTVYSQYKGYSNWISESVYLTGMADFYFHQYVIKIKDGNETVITSDPIEIGENQLIIEPCGSQYGYMETLKFKYKVEIIYDGITYRCELEGLYHIDYPTTEDVKRAAREAGYDI